MGGGEEAARLDLLTKPRGISREMRSGRRDVAPLGWIAVLWLCRCSALRQPLRPGSALHARRPKTADEWREWRRKEGSSSARKPADDDLARRAQRWADAVGADASTLDGLPVARRREFLDEWERDLPKNDAPPRTAPTEGASTEINVDWERRVQFDALRDGNALRQNDVLNKAIRSDKRLLVKPLDHLRVVLERARHVRPRSCMNGF